MKPLALSSICFGLCLILLITGYAIYEKDTIKIGICAFSLALLTFALKSAYRTYKIFNK